VSQSNLVSTVTKTSEGLQLSGDFVYATIEKTVHNTDGMLESHTSPSISIDCNKMTKIDSAGIALLIEWKRTCKEQQKEFKVVNANEKAASLITTYKLKEILGLSS